jgi:hypothetical protein
VKFLVDQKNIPAIQATDASIRLVEFYNSENKNTEYSYTFTLSQA